MNNPMTKNDIDLLLPFYVNNTLNEKEVKQVDQALIENKVLREELLYLQKLHAQIRQQKTEYSPSELGLKRLQNDQRLNKGGLQLEIIARAKNRWKYGAMAACLMLVVLTVTDMGIDDTYEAAGGAEVSHHKGIIASVTFVPNATEEQIRKLLVNQHVFIIDGPSAIGVYRLVIVDGDDSAIKELAIQVDIIESIQIE